MSSRKPAAGAALEDTALPPSIVSQADVTRLLRELESYEEVAEQRSLAKGAAKAAKPVRYSDHLRAVADELSLELSRRADRQKLLRFLEYVRTKTPVISVYFAREPSYETQTRLVTWFRREVHPQALLDVGVRPSIIGGCIVRSANRYFDYSLAAGLDQADETLHKRIKMVVRR